MGNAIITFLGRLFVEEWAFGNSLEGEPPDLELLGDCGATLAEVHGCIAVQRVSKSDKRLHGSLREFWTSTDQLRRAGLLSERAARHHMNHARETLPL